MRTTAGCRIHFSLAGASLSLVWVGAVKYPAISTDSWKTWLTEQRILLLEPWLN